MGERTEIPKVKLPLTLDFCSPQGEDFTRISRFFDNLKEGRLTTTKCTACGQLNWPPRVVCPGCHSDELEWVDLPTRGKLWAFTEMRLGAPLGFEEEVPFSIGIVELNEVGLRMLSRIDTPFEQLDFDMTMKMTVVKLPGDKVIYRFVAVE